MKNTKLITLFLLSITVLFTSCQDIGADRPTVLDGKANTNNVLVEPEETFTAPVRPTGAVVVEPGHCGCSAGKPITVGECGAICSARQTSSENEETLFFSVELKPEITLDVYANLLGWCTTEIEGDDGNLITGASCSIEIKDEDGNISFANFENYNESNLTLNIGGFQDDITYRLTLVERTSGARSSTFQMRKYSMTEQGSIRGPLEYMPINRYSCGIRNGGATSQNQDDFERFHLYFNSETRPEPLQEDTIGNFFCHDLGPTGNAPPTNSPLFEETTGVFTLWNKEDPRFYSLDGDDIEDINQIIEREVNLQGARLSETPRFFAMLEWISAFDDGNASPGESSSGTEVELVNKQLGYYMTPFLDPTTFRAYCPKEEHYFSGSALFQAMRETISKDTEALYVAKQDNACDFLLVNKSVVEDIWFYRENGVAIKPTDETIKGKQVQFYWPANPASPYIKKSHQRVYTIRSTSELADACSSTVGSTAGSTNSSGVRTNIPPHDKRIGCIPVLGSGD